MTTKEEADKRRNEEAEARAERDKDLDLSPCPKCNCMTKSIRLGRAKYQCGKCKADKSLSDVYYYEAITSKQGEKK